MSTSRRTRPVAPALVVAAAMALAAAVALAACSTPSASPAVTLTPVVSPSAAPRPSSLATVEIVEPADGATVEGTTAHVVLKLNGATIVSETTTNIRPDQGHVHLFLNGEVVSMNYGLEQDLLVVPGTYVLRAEFVAADHAPFNPRVESGDVVFTVK
jgi:hypothetical protein